MNEIKDILSKYNLKIESLKLNNNIKIINTKDGKYVIKKKKSEDTRDLFKHLNSKNFNNYLDYINKDDNDNYLIFPYVDTVTDEADIIATDMIITVSNLHARTLFYKNYPLYEVKTFYEEKINVIEELEKYYENLRMMFEEENFLPPSHYLLLRNISWIFYSLDSSKYFLNKWYEIEKEKKNKRVCLIHGNLELNHFIGNENKFLISWDNARNDSPVFDLVTFYKNNYKDISFYNIFKIYEERFPLLEEERYLLFLLLLIPDKLKLDKSEIINTKNVYYLIKYLTSSSDIISNYHSSYSNGQKNQHEK